MVLCLCACEPKTTAPTWQEQRPDNFAEVYAKQQRGELTLKEALAEVGIGRTRWYELARETAV